MKNSKKQKLQNGKRSRRAKRTRAKVQGTSEKPRLSVFRSNMFIYTQLIDDEKGITLASHFDLLKKADIVGQELAKKAKGKNIGQAVFDKGPYTYHGYVKKLAEAARKEGLSF